MSVPARSLLQAPDSAIELRSEERSDQDFGRLHVSGVVSSDYRTDHDKEAPVYAEEQVNLVALLGLCLMGHALFQIVKIELPDLDFWRLLGVHAVTSWSTVVLGMSLLGEKPTTAALIGLGVVAGNCIFSLLTVKP